LKKKEKIKKIKVVTHNGVKSQIINYLICFDVFISGKRHNQIILNKMPISAQKLTKKQK